MDEPYRIADVEREGFPALQLISPRGISATFVPAAGMVCCSLTHHGEERLGQRDGLRDYATRGATMGIPFLHPWANRLARMGYAVGHVSIDLPPDSPLVHDDGNGLPIHGLLAGCPDWGIVERQAGAAAARIEAQLEIGPGSEIFKLFPFPHRVKLGAILSGTSLAIVTTVLATGDVAVPVAFGYHPYFHLPNVPRAEWTVTLPVRRRAHLDARNLPTGKSEAVTIPPGPLGTRTFDDLFSEIGNQPVFKLSGGGRTISVAFGPGYPVAVVYAPANDDVVCFEPMTAPTNPFEGGTPLRWVQAGASFTAMFEISVSQVTSTSA